MIGDKETQELEKHQVFQWTAVKVAVVKDKKLLLGERLDKEDYGLYEIPGGKPEVGENLNEAAKREVREETGVDIEVDVGDPLYVTQNSKNSIIFIVYKSNFVIGDVVEKTEELGKIDFYNKSQVKELLNKKQLRQYVIQLAEMFVNGELDG